MYLIYINPGKQNLEKKQIGNAELGMRNDGIEAILYSAFRVPNSEFLIPHSPFPIPHSLHDFISLYNQAFAVTHSRFTVAGEIDKTSAVSFIVNPEK